MKDEIRIQVRFNIEEKGFSYHDAFYFTEAEYAALKPDDLEAQKRARFDGYVKAMQNLAEPAKPTDEELQAQLDELDRMRSEVVQRKAELAADLIAADVIVADVALPVK